MESQIVFNKKKITASLKKDIELCQEVSIIDKDGYINYDNFAKNEDKKVEKAFNRIRKYKEKEDFLADEEDFKKEMEYLNSGKYYLAEMESEAEAERIRRMVSEEWRK